jgi:hypothetical protein
VNFIIATLWTYLTMKSRLMHRELQKDYADKADHPRRNRRKETIYDEVEEC